MARSQLLCRETEATGARPWIVGVTSRPRARVCLVCFPHAGGAAVAYRTWAERLPGRTEVRAIELPGRGSRLLERPVNRLDLLVEPLAASIAATLERPYVFFGHSFGALLAFELVRRLRRTGSRGPLALVVSASAAPHRMGSRPPQGSASDRELVARLRRFGGTPAAVLEDPEMVSLLIPAFRADLEMADDYAYAHEPPLDVPIVAFGGAADPLVDEESLNAWKDQTTARFTLHMFSGEHFFVHSNRDAVLEVLDRELGQILDGRA